ncbi:MAG: hypothetical protein ABSH20_08410 [Tepidisphaeraceae bacterium]|jgi:hypothetical protein
MPHILDQFLESISPQRTILDIGMKIDRALNTFPVPAQWTGNHDSFQEMVIQFLCHVDQHLAGASSRRPPMPPYDLGHCVDVFESIYGSMGIHRAYDLARTGHEGGVYRVLRDFAAALVMRAHRHTIAKPISDFLWDMTEEGRMEMARHYIARFGSYLPPEWLEHGGVPVARNLKQILQQHPELMVKIMSLDRSRR